MRLDLIESLLQVFKRLSSIRWLKSIGTDHKRVFATMLWVGFYLGIAKGTGALKELVVAAKYGAGATVDAYAFLFSISNFAVGVITSVLITVILPLLIRLSNETPQLLVQFRRELFMVTLIVGGVMGTIFYFVMMFLVAHNNVGLYQAAQLQALPMIFPMSIVTAFGILSAMLSMRLMAQFRNINSVLDGVPALGILIFLLVLPTNTSAPLIWGIVLGVLLQALFLLIALFGRDQFEFPSLRIRSKVWPLAIRLMSILFFAQILVSISNVLDQLMVAHLGTGSNASLGYNNRIMSLVLSLGTITLTRSLLPILSDLQTKNPARAQHLTMRWMTVLFILGTITALVGWVIAPRLVNLLFHRGAFTSDDSKMVTGVFRFALLQLPFYFPQIVVVQLIASRGNYLPLLYVGIIEAIVKLAANIVTIPIMGVNGTSFSTAIMYMIALPLICYFGLFRLDGSSAHAY